MSRYGRLGEVVTTLMWEGLQVPLARMRVAHCATWRCRAHCTWQRWTGRRVSSKPWPVAIRDALIKLGPVFVKLGQILSVRTDLIPSALAEALHSLQSDVPPVPLAAVRPTIESALGTSIEEGFAAFPDAPMAAGSLAQVYDARLADGRRVAVKVKRPGIDDQVAEDLRVLVWLAGRAERYLPQSRPYRPVSAARELERYTLGELDFRNEAQVTQEVRARFEDWEDVLVPEIIRATSDVLVMEFIESFPLDDLETMRAGGIDRRALIRVGLDAVLAQIFEFRVFHADPHPGNLHVSPDGKLVFLDFGIYGRIDKSLRRDSAVLMWTLARGEVHLSSFFLQKLATLEPDADVRGFRRAIEERYHEWLGSTVGEYGIARLVYEEFALGARYGVIMPSSIILLGKALVTIEGVALALDPDLDIATEAEPYLSRLRGDILSPTRLLEGARRALPIWLDVLERLPVGLAEWLDRRVADGGMSGRGGSNLADRRATGRAVWAGSLVLAGALLITAASSWSAAPAIGVALLGLGLFFGLRKP